MANWDSKTDQELIEEAYRGNTSQGAIAEMMRRLREALVAQHHATNKLTERLYWFTVALFVVAFIAAIPSVWDLFKRL